jgi:hypothetical protein
LKTPLGDHHDQHGQRECRKRSDRNWIRDAVINPQGGPAMCRPGIRGIWTLAVAGILAWQTTVATQVTPLGRFKFGVLQGEVTLNRGTSLLVVLGIEGRLQRPQIDEFRVWLLLGDGSSAPLRERSPKPGEDPMMVVGGGVSTMFSFRFDNVYPIAVVVGRGSEFQVYPIPLQRTQAE